MKKNPPFSKIPFEIRLKIISLIGIDVTLQFIKKKTEDEKIWNYENDRDVDKSSIKFHVKNNVIIHELFGYFKEDVCRKAFLIFERVIIDIHDSYGTLKLSQFIPLKINHLVFVKKEHIKAIEMEKKCENRFKNLRSIDIFESCYKGIGANKLNFLLKLGSNLENFFKEKPIEKDEFSKENLDIIRKIKNVSLYFYDVKLAKEYFKPNENKKSNIMNAQLHFQTEMSSLRDSNHCKEFIANICKINHSTVMDFQFSWVYFSYLTSNEIITILNAFPHLHTLNIKRSSIDIDGFLYVLENTKVEVLQLGSEMMGNCRDDSEIHKKIEKRLEDLENSYLKILTFQSEYDLSGRKCWFKGKKTHMSQTFGKILFKCKALHTLRLSELNHEEVSIINTLKNLKNLTCELTNPTPFKELLKNESLESLHLIMVKSRMGGRSRRDYGAKKTSWSDDWYRKQIPELFEKLIKMPKLLFLTMEGYAWNNLSNYLYGKKGMNLFEESSIVEVKNKETLINNAYWKNVGAKKVYDWQKVSFFKTSVYGWVLFEKEQ